MIEIFNDKKIIFEGNYWDFPNDPVSLSILIEKMGLKVKTQIYKYE